jgi:hypothetical protein
MSAQPRSELGCWLSIQIVTSSSASTDKDTHAAAAVGVLEHLPVPANPAGYLRLIRFGRRHDSTLWAIEGNGSFGAD